MKLKNVNLTEGVIWKQILAFAFPLLLINLMQQLYSIADLMIVGNFSGVDAMAGIGATTSVINMLIGLALGLATGISVVTVQVNSSEDFDGLYKVVHTGYALAIVSGLALTAAGYFLSPALLQLMGTPLDILPFSTTYLRIYFLGTLPVTIYNIGAGILRGVGDTRHPFIFLALGVLLNIALDFLFVGLFGWGIRGAGWAYVIAQTVTALLVTLSLTTSMTPFRLFLRDISFHPAVLVRSLRVGIPAGLQTFIVAVSNVFVQASINSFGKHAVAGFSAATRTDSFVFVLISGLALSAMTFTGANMGVERRERIKRGLHHSLLLTFILVALLSGLFILLRRQVAAAFNPDPVVIGYTARIIVILLSFYWISAMTEVMGAVLRGMGKAIFPMVASLICQAGVRLVWIYAVMPAWPSIDAITLAYPVSWTIHLIAFGIYLRIKGGSMFKETSTDPI
ncbi:MAG: MATE family efflux transporter [Clostridiaceae bacterium]|jgi:putative MATE family efflux protein|nr:MATE family efflux transporter [Clostridiaceae bacterium]